MQVVALPKDTYATDIHWLPSASHKQGSHLETFVLACTDGKFLLVSRSGRVEKTVDAHRGAVMGTRWSKDGTAMLTCKDLLNYLTSRVVTVMFDRGRGWLYKDLVEVGDA